jgi:hypothetical protein
MAYLSFKINEQYQRGTKNFFNYGTQPKVEQSILLTSYLYNFTTTGSTAKDIRLKPIAVPDPNLEIYAYE